MTHMRVQVKGGEQGWVTHWEDHRDVLGVRVTTMANPREVSTQLDPESLRECWGEGSAGDLQADAEKRGPSATCPLGPHLEKGDCLLHIHLDPV